MRKMRVFAVSLCPEERLAESGSGEGEELRAGVGGWGHMQRQSKSKANYISF